MNTTTITIKTTSETKTKAQKRAEALGVNLSTVINEYLKQFIKTKTTTAGRSEEEPSDYLIQLMKDGKVARKKGKASPVFDNAKGAIDWLHREE